MWSRIDSPVPGTFTRRTATVMISAPEASCASRIAAIDENLPVPTMSRDVNSLPPSTRLVSDMTPPSLARPIARSAAAHRPNDLDPITVLEERRGVRALRRHLAVERDGGVLPRYLQ